MNGTKYERVGKEFCVVLLHRLDRRCNRREHRLDGRVQFWGQYKKGSGAHECHEEIEEDRKVVWKVLPRDLRLKKSLRA